MEPEKLQLAIEMAENGNIEAAAYLGNQYYFGWDVLEQDYSKALKFLTIAAEGGDAMSQFLLGYMYGAGRGVERDSVKAFEWFLKAAEQGIPEAMYNVGGALLQSSDPEKKAEGRQWMIRSADAGYDAAQDYDFDDEDEDEDDA